MSSRQVRKLRELQSSPQEDQASAESEDDEDDGDVRKASVFAALTDSSESQEAAAPAATAAPSTETASSKPRKQRRGKRRTEREQAANQDCVETNEDDLEQVSAEPVSGEPDPPESVGTSSGAGPLSMSRADFSAETERQRVFGNARGMGRSQRRAPARARGQAEGRTLHHRRLFLVSLTADEPWTKPENSTSMLAKVDKDGAAVFGFEETPGSTRELATLRQVLSQEDPQLLQQYLQQRSPFSLDGLLVMAEHHWRQGSHEQARELVRRAVYTLECALSPDFSPFQNTGLGPGALRPRVRLEIEAGLDWPGWSWLRALWLHMHCLRGQGMHRTALEVCKLLLACTLPRDPVCSLLFFDYLCLRSRSFQALHDLTSLPTVYGLTSCSALPFAERLDYAFPNIAFSLALCTLLARGAPDLAALSSISLDTLLQGTEDDEWDEDMRAHARLLRALLFFPGCLRPLLDQCDVNMQSKPNGSESWAELLASPPFANAMDFRHSQHAAAHGRICIAYAKLCGPFWKDGVKWLHACCVRWVRLHCNEVFVKDIEATRRAWADSGFAAGQALRDYDDLLPDTAENSAPAAPALMDRALTARLHPPRNLFAGDGLAGGRPGEASANMSLHSPPAILFFQSLLPWSTLDLTGVQVSPLFWRDVGWGVKSLAEGMFLLGVGLLADIWRAARSCLGR